VGREYIFQSANEEWSDPTLEIIEVGAQACLLKEPGRSEDGGEELNKSSELEPVLGPPFQQARLLNGFPTL